MAHFGGPYVNPRNAERLLMAANTKDVLVDNVRRCHKWGSAPKFQSLLVPLAQSISAFDAFCKLLAFPFDGGSEVGDAES